MEDVPLGESWKVHIFHCMKKESILLLHIQEKHLANYSQKRSIISKQSKLIPKELRYQEKIHAIIRYAKRKRYPSNSPQILFYFYLKNKKKQNMQYGNAIICKANSNLMMTL
jgi:hypothetical protein